MLKLQPFLNCYTKLLLVSSTQHIVTAYWHVLFQAQQKKDEQKVEKTTVWLKGL